MRVYEAAPTIGGGTRTMELTLPGFRHDVCSSIVPLTLASPFFRTVDWSALGVELVQPDAPVAHALDGGRAMVLERSFTATAAGLDHDRRTDDGSAWRRLFGPLARDADKLGRELLQPVIHVPRHPLALARFGPPALRSASGLARSRFRGEGAQALFGGLATHSMLALDRPLSASFGLVLGLYAHAVGWPMVRGGTAALGEALVGEIRRLGGEVGTGHRVRSLDDIPSARVVILDTTPQAAVAIAGERLPPRTRRRYERFRYGPGVFKVDWALDGPIPWTADGLRRGGHRPPRRPAGRGRPLGAAGRGRARPGSAVHAARPVPPVGSVAGAGRQDDRLGLLPRPIGLGRGHDRPHRGPGRALRAGVPRPDPRSRRARRRR